MVVIINVLTALISAICGHLLTLRDFFLFSSRKYKKKHKSSKETAYANYLNSNLVNKLNLKENINRPYSRLLLNINTRNTTPEN